MIGQECIDELAAEVGLRAEVAAITERAMRGEIDFAPALRERVALMKGLRAEVVERVLRERIEITPGALVLDCDHARFGAHTALVSGGFSSFVRAGRQEDRVSRDSGQIICSAKQTSTRAA